MEESVVASMKWMDRQWREGFGGGVTKSVTG
jgi:hypothetical protein